MTLANCERLLKHFTDLVDGTIEPQKGHKNWHDVIHNAKVRANLMKERIEWKSSERFMMKHGRTVEAKEEPKEEVKKEPKKDGKKSA